MCMRLKFSKLWIERYNVSQITSNGEVVEKMVSKIGQVTPLPHTRQLYIMPAEMISYRSANTLLDKVKMKIFLLLIIILTCMKQMTTRMTPLLWSHSQSNHDLTVYLAASLIWPGKYLIVIAYLNKFTTRTRLLFLPSSPTLPFHHFADSLKVKAILLDTYIENTKVLHNLSLYFISTSNCGLTLLTLFPKAIYSEYKLFFLLHHGCPWPRYHPFLSGFLQQWPSNLIVSCFLSIYLQHIKDIFFL